MLHLEIWTPDASWHRAGICESGKARQTATGRDGGLFTIPSGASDPDSFLRLPALPTIAEIAEAFRGLQFSIFGSFGQFWQSSASRNASSLRISEKADR
jgi:hypothetical protein